MLFSSGRGLNMQKAPVLDNTTTTADGQGNASANEMILSTTLQECIQEAILQLNYESAQFLSELLFAECHRPDISQLERMDAVYLHSLALYLNEDYHSSMHIAEEYKDVHLGIAYVYARCALRVSQNMSSAFSSLINAMNNRRALVSELVHIPDIATVNCLAGKLLQKMDKLKEATNYHSDALSLNPCLWESYTALCQMKANIDMKKFYSILSVHNHHSNKSKINKNHPTPYKTRLIHNSNNTNKLFSTEPTASSLLSSSSSASSSASSNISSSRFPSTLVNKEDSKDQIAIAKVRSKNSSQKPKNSSPFAGRMDEKNIKQQSKIASRMKLLTTTPSKYTNMERLNNFKTPKTYTNNGSFKRSTTSQQDPSLKPVILTSTYSPHSTFATTGLADVIFLFARILKASSSYDLYKAIRLITTALPPHIRDYMPWCSAQLGKLHFELVNYDMSLKCFQKLRELQPTRIKDLEIYSTLLWHLNDKAKLSVLSSEMMDIGRTRPETWCCKGNFYSLQKNHEEAIKAFEKCTQLDPTFAYAYTLQGHEHSSNDTFDTAKNCYRKAIVCDPRHYNAYYGLGMCCMKLGQYEEAILFFEKARTINPVNVILICCCGVASEKLHSQENALRYYELACELQPNSSLAKFKRAHLLYTMERYSVALKHFEELTKLAPDEATVHFLLGQLYQIMGRKNEAVKEFTIAMNLDPKGNQLIMDALEKCHTQS